MRCLTFPWDEIVFSTIIALILVGLAVIAVSAV